MPSNRVVISDVLSALGQLSNQDLNTIIKEALSLRAKRATPKLDEREANLIQRIDEVIPVGESKRYIYLIQKAKKTGLSQKEHEEFSELNEKIELYNANRIRLLGELAAIRGVSLETVMNQLGIRPINA